MATVLASSEQQLIQAFLAKVRRQLVACEFGQWQPLPAAEATAVQLRFQPAQKVDTVDHIAIVQIRYVPVLQGRAHPPHFQVGVAQHQCFFRFKIVMKVKLPGHPIALQQTQMACVGSQNSPWYQGLCSFNGITSHSLRKIFNTSWTTFTH